MYFYVFLEDLLCIAQKSLDSASATRRIGVVRCNKPQRIQVEVIG
jgi:hypothetical protein